MIYSNWVLLLGLVALFLLSPVVVGLVRCSFRLNPNWRDEVLPKMDTLKINGPELQRLLDGQTPSTIR